MVTVETTVTRRAQIAILLASYQKDKINEMTYVSMFMTSYPSVRAVVDYVVVGVIHFTFELVHCHISCEAPPAPAAACTFLGEH